MRELWIKLAAGTIFTFDDKGYLRTANGILSLKDFEEVSLHNDVYVEPKSTLQYTDSLDICYFFYLHKMKKCTASLCGVHTKGKRFIGMTGPIEHPVIEEEICPECKGLGEVP